MVIGVSLRELWSAAAVVSARGGIEVGQDAEVDLIPAAGEVRGL
jgi:hypothetical protein